MTVLGPINFFAGNRLKFVQAPYGSPYPTSLIAREILPLVPRADQQAGRAEESQDAAVNGNRL